MGGRRQITPWVSYESRNAPYIESAHTNMLTVAYANVLTAISNNPYDDYTEYDANDGYLGIGFTLASFPSLYDMFGKFLSGMDVESMLDKALDKFLNTDETENQMEGEKTIYDEGLSYQTRPQLCLAARDGNFVASSSFIVGAAQIEDQRIKDLATRKAEIQFALLPELNKHLNDYLNWQKNAITSYALTMKSYYTCQFNSDTMNYRMAYSDILWPLYVADYMVDYLSTLDFKTNIRKQMAQIRKRSTLSGILLIASNVVTGAIVGSYCYPGIGTAVGAVVGLLIGIAQWLLE